MTLPSNLPAELIGRRPDVVADRWRVEAASQDIKVAKAQFYPNISLNGLVGLQSRGFDNFLDAGSRVLGIGPALSLPIFDGGRLHAQSDAARAQQPCGLNGKLSDRTAAPDSNCIAWLNLRILRCHIASWKNIRQKQHLFIRQPGFNFYMTDIGIRDADIFRLTTRKSTQHVGIAKQTGRRLSHDFARHFRIGIGTVAQ